MIESKVFYHIPASVIEVAGKGFLGLNNCMEVAETSNPCEGKCKYRCGPSYVPLPVGKVCWRSNAIADEPGLLPCADGPHVIKISSHQHVNCQFSCSESACRGTVRLCRYVSSSGQWSA